MLSPYKINPSNTKKRSKKALKTDFFNNSDQEPHLKGPQMTSNDLKRPQSTSKESSKKTKRKNNLKGGSIQENVEINEHYLDKIPKNNDT